MFTLIKFVQRMQNCKPHQENVWLTRKKGNVFNYSVPRWELIKDTAMKSSEPINHSHARFFLLLNLITVKREASSDRRNRTIPPALPQEPFQANDYCVNSVGLIKTLIRNNSFWVLSMHVAFKAGKTFSFNNWLLFNSVDTPRMSKKVINYC